ncbi:MAG: sigma-70 family RNA polymerase sigma factor [Solirubrobacteraceae bacterium]
MADDHALVERLRAGDEEAFMDLVVRWSPSLMRVARMYVPSNAVAEEVVQETWLAALQGLDRFEERSSLRTWIFSILVNQARKRAVRDARSVPFSSIEEDDGPAVEPSVFGADGRWTSAPARLDADPETGLLAGELRAQLLAAVDTLTRDQRAVITLRDLVGLTAAETCELLEITDGSQRVLLHRARARVRTVLRPIVEAQA